MITRRARKREKTRIESIKKVEELGSHPSIPQKKTLLSLLPQQVRVFLLIPFFLPTCLIH
jgi:hypothetical protein